jgi:pyrroloquinoline quinone biosynthesis protein D
MVVSSENQRPRSAVEGRDLGDEYLIYDPDTDHVHVLNGTAREIFLLCNGSRTAEEIAAELARKYGVEPSVTLADTRETLRQLSELGALDWS